MECLSVSMYVCLCVTSSLAAEHVTASALTFRVETESKLLVCAWHLQTAIINKINQKCLCEFIFCKEGQTIRQCYAVCRYVIRNQIEHSFLLSTEEQSLWLRGPPTERSKPEGKWSKPVLWLGAGRQVQKIRWVKTNQRLKFSITLNCCVLLFLQPDAF